MNNKHESKIENIIGIGGALATGIPNPISKNFFKSVNRLCTAAIDIPAASLESKAQEIRALSEARVNIIKNQGEQISERMNVPEVYVEIASQKYAAKIVKEQLNLDIIGSIAKDDLNQKEFDKTDNISEEEINDDWLNEFENYAKLKSSDDMRLIFGKILSGEIQRPGTFSIKTIRLISQLDRKAAKLFQLLCSQCVSMVLYNSNVIDARVVTFSGSAISNSLKPFGLSFDNLNILQEYGLIITDYNSYMNYSSCIPNEKMEVIAYLSFGSKNYVLTPIDLKNYDKIVKLNGVALTKAGIELLKIIPIKVSPKYKKELIIFFEKKRLKMTNL